MALIISPKITKEQVRQLSEYFNLRKIPKDRSYLELGNFNDNFYFANLGKVPLYVILTGYGGASVGFAVAQYEKNYKNKDPYPEAYFLGSILKARRAVNLHLADILYASDTYGEDEWAQSIYRIAQRRKVKKITKPSKNLVERITATSKREGIVLKHGKILSRWHPGYIKDYKNVINLVDEGFWWKFALSTDRYKNHNFDGGEIECASFLSTCRLARVPAIALLYVRDERISKEGYDRLSYRIVRKEDKTRAQENILKLIKLSLQSLI